MGLTGEQYTIQVKASADMQSFNNVKKELNTLLSDLNRPGMESQWGISKAQRQEFSKAITQFKQDFESSFNKELGTINLSALSEKMKAHGTNVQAIGQAYQLLGMKGSHAFRELSAEIITTNRDLSHTKTIWDDMFKTMSNTIKWGISSSLMNTFTGSVQKAYGYVKDLDKSLTNIRIVSGASADEMERFAKQANSAAKNLGATTLDYTDAALIYYQQGLPDKEITQRTEVTMKMANVLETSAEEVSNYMTAIWNNFYEEGGPTLEYYADVLAKLGAATASSAKEISDGLEKFAAISKTVGLSYEYAAAALTTVTAATRQSADVVGTAFKTLFARMQDLELGETLDDGVTLGKYSEALKAVGINIMESNGELKDMDKILDEMGSKWDTLTKAQQVSLAQTVAGTRQYTQLVALMDNWDDFQKNITMAGRATGELNKQQEIYMDSVEAAQNRAKASAEELYSAIFDEETIKDLAGAVENLASLFTNLANAVGGGNNALALFGGRILQNVSKNIGQSAIKFKENRDRNKRNDALLQAEADITEKFAGQDLSDSVHNQIVGWKKDFLEYGNLIENTQQNEIDKLINTQVELSKQKDLWDANIRAAKEYWETVKGTVTKNEKESQRDFTNDDDLTTTLDDFKVLNNEFDFLKSQLDFSKDLLRKREGAPLIGSNADIDAIKKYLDYLDNVQTSLESIFSQMRKTNLGNENFETVFKDDENLGDAHVKANAAIKALKELQQMYQNGDFLASKEDKDFFNERILDAVDLLQRSQDKISNFIEKNNPSKHLETIGQAIDGQGRDIEAGLERNVGKIESFKEKFDFGAMIQGATEFAGALAEVIGAINSLRSSFEILNNDEATFGDKLAALSTIIYSLIFGFKSLASMFTIVSAGWTKVTTTTVLSAVGLKSVSIEANKATKELNELAAAQLAAQSTAQGNANAQLLQATNLKFTSKAANMASGSTLALNRGTVTAGKTVSGFAGIAAKLGLSVGKLALACGIAAAALVAVGVAIYAIHRKLTEEERAIKRLESAQESLNKKITETKENLELLTSAFEQYTNVLKILEDCTKGTDKWNEALKNVNQTVLDLLESYPALLEIEGLVTRDTETGALTLDKEILQKYIKQLEQSADMQVMAQMGLRAWTTNQNNNLTLKELQKDTKAEQSFSFLERLRRKFEGEGDKPKLTEEEIKSLAGLTKKEYEKAIQDLANELEASGRMYGTTTDAWVDKMKAYQDEIDGYVQETKSASTQMKNVAQMLAGLLLDEDASDIENKITTQYINKNLAANQAAVYQEMSKAFKQSDDNPEKYAQYVKELTQATGGKYVMVPGANADTNLITGKDDNRKYKVYNTETQKEEELTAEEFAAFVGTGRTANQVKENHFGERGSVIVSDFAKRAGISEELAEQILSGTLDINNISQEDYEKINSQKDNYAEYLRESAKLDPYATRLLMDDVLGEGTDVFDFENSVKKTVDQWDPEKQAKNAAIKWKKALSDAAAELGVSTDALEAYTNQLLDLNPLLKEQSDLLLDVAKHHFILTKHLNNLNKVMADEDNDNIFNKWKKGAELTTDEMEVVGSAIKEIKAIFGEDISEDFIKEHLEDIRKLAKGDESVLDDLQKAAAEDIVLGIKIDDQFKTEQDNLINQINALDIPNIEIGTSLDETGLTTYLQELLSKSAITADEANNILKTIGFEPEVTMQKIDFKDIQTAENGTSYYWEDAEGNRHEVNQSAYTEASTNGSVSIPIINGKEIKYKGANKNNFDFKPKDDGKGGGSKKKSKVKKTENEKDRYHDVNIELKQLSDEFEKLNDQKEKLFGGDLIKNAAKQIENLNKQIETTNKKMSIAKDEAAELRKKLASQGVKFNEDGTMSNYLTLYDKKLKELNAVESKYEKMSEKQREKYQDTYEKAQEKFQKFVEDMSRYNEVVTQLLPELEANNQDSINKQIELQIESFNYEIELRLDLKDAELEWNEFKKKIIDGIEDDDILGNAKARLVDISSYYREDGTGIIQENAEHIQELLAELEEMDKKGSDVYGKDSTQDRVTALEDLQKYYQELMKNLEEVQEIQEEMKQSQLDMMDKAEEKFGEQIEMYEHLSGLIDHDMNLITLTYGETAYDKLAEYYKQQSENNKSQLDFQRQRVEIWRQQMEAEEEGSEAWEKAKENWLAAINDANASLEASIENLKDKYLNAINLIFDKLNDKVTDGAGLDYIAEEWDLINQNADQYLDTVNSLFEMQSLENKYLDAIDDTDNVKAQQKLQKMMEEELKMLEEKDKLTQYDIDRANQKYEIALKQIALEEAQQNKNSMRLRRDTQGNYTYQFVADDEQVSQLQDELGDLYNSLYNLDVEQYKSNLDQLQSVYVEFQEKMKEAAQINDPEERAARELLIREQYEELINGIVNENEVVRNNLYESTFNDLAYLYDKNVEDFTNMTQAEQDALMNGLIPYWNSGIQSMADVFAGEGGFLPTCKDAFDELNQATKEYEDELQEYYNIAGKSIDDISSGYDKTSEQIKQLIKDNGELIETYNTELTAIKNVVTELNSLITKYKEAELAAKTAAEEAYKYWAAAYGKAADEVEGSKLGQQPQQQNEEPQKDVNEPKKEEPKKPSLTKGSYVNVKSGVKWYSNSYGGGKSGTARSGKITLINANGSHPYNIEGLGWIKKSDIVGYDTGGYTGNWNSREGRLAMLHEKELILNKQDTQNMLNAMQVLRNITANLGTTIMEKMASITAGNMNAIANNFNNGLEQQVHIDAQFPNVTNSTEIEDALNNLVNRASQYITK